MLSYHIISSQTLTLIRDWRATREDARSSQSIDRIASQLRNHLLTGIDAKCTRILKPGHHDGTIRYNFCSKRIRSGPDPPHMKFQASYIVSRLCMWFGYNGSRSLRNLDRQGAGQYLLWSRIWERKVPEVVMRILHVMCHGWSCESWKKLFTSFWNMLSSQNTMFHILNVLKFSTPNCDFTILSLVRIVDDVNACALHLLSSPSFMKVKLWGSGFGIENS